MTAPLVRARVVEYLAAHVVPGVRRWNGQVPVEADPEVMAHELGISPHDANETLWTLQKQQIVTFKERKGPKGSVLSHIRIADTALKSMPVDTITHVISTDEELLNQAIDIVEVAQDISDEAIKSYPGTECKNRAVSPEWCVEHDSHWPRGDHHCVAEWERLNPGIDEDEPGASAQNTDASTDSPEAIAEDDDLPAILVPPTLDEYPQIQQVMVKALRVRALGQAVDLLMDSGQDDLAGMIVTKSEGLSSLEGEVLALAMVLGWMDENGQPV